MNRFYMVWCEAWRYPGNHVPRYKHDSEESATREAERLAQMNPGVPFFVCTVGEVVKCEVSPPSREILMIPNPVTLRVFGVPDMVPPDVGADEEPF